MVCDLFERLGRLACRSTGKFYLTFYQPMPEGRVLPAFDQLQIGQMVQEIPAKSAFIVAEKGTATSVAAAGEIPYKLVPNEQSSYADLRAATTASGRSITPQIHRGSFSAARSRWPISAWRMLGPPNGKHDVSARRR